MAANQAWRTRIAGAVAAGCVPVAALGAAAGGPAWMPIWVVLAVVAVGALVLGATLAQRAIAGDPEPNTGDGPSSSVLFVALDAGERLRRDARAPSAAVAEVAGARALRERRAVAPALRDVAAPPPSAGAAPRATMGEVSYVAGRPNVLSMEVRLPPVDAEGPLASDGTCVRRDEGGETVLALGGALDARTLPAIAPTLEAVAVERGRAVTLDLSALALLDGAGVKALVRLRSRCVASGGALRAVGLRKQPLALLKLLRVEREFAG